MYSCVCGVCMYEREGGKNSILLHDWKMMHLTTCFAHDFSKNHLEVIWCVFVFFHILLPTFQDDVHIFCLEDQIKGEIRSVLDLTEETLPIRV
jgi:hypothetical protein